MMRTMRKVVVMLCVLAAFFGALAACSKVVPSYTVTFEINGGIGAVKSQTVNPGGKITEPNPELVGRIGYRFDGWWTKSGEADDYGVLWNFDTDKVNSNVKLYAKWVQQVTVTLDANGGSAPSPAAYTFDKASVITTQPSSVRGGYILKGWTTGKDNASTKVTFPYTAQSSITLYALWEQEASAAEQWTVTLNANSGSLASGVTSPIKVDKGAEISAEPLAQKSGYRFDGWYTAAAGGTKIAFPYTPTADTEIFAQYVQQLTVTFKDGSEDYGEAVVDINGIVEAPDEPEKSGYSFIGWYTGNGTPDWGNEWDFEQDSVTDNITLYARWDDLSNPLVRYTVTFDANGGEWDEEQAETELIIYEGEIIPASHVPAVSRNGYRFDGWYSHATAGTKVEFPYTPTDDITLYARWVEQVTLTFDANGGTLTDQERIVLDKGDTVLKPSDPIYIGYRFAGWWTDNGASTWGTEVAFADPYQVNGNQTLYAKWIEQVTVTFKNGINTYHTETIDKGVAISKPADPTDASKMFLGWFEAATGGTALTFPLTVNESKILYAQWAERFVVTLLVDGEIIDNINVVQGSPVDVATELPVLTAQDINNIMLSGRYTFAGWCEQGTGAVLSGTYTPAANVTLEAKLNYIDDATYFDNTWTPITTAAELNDAVNDDTAGAKYYLVKNIDLTGYNWTMATKSFAGIFDGNGYVIKNLTVSTSGNAGMFLNAGGAGAELRNIVFDNPKVSSTSNRAGILFAEASNVIIENIAVIGSYAANPEANITVSGSQAAGVGLLIGQASSNSVITIRNVSITDAKAKNSNGAAGLIGRVSGVAGDTSNISVQDLYLENVYIDGSAASALFGRMGAGNDRQVDTITLTRLVMNNVNMLAGTKNIIFGVDGGAKISNFTGNDIYFAGTSGLNVGYDKTVSNLKNNAAADAQWWSDTLGGKRLWESGADTYVLKIVAQSAVSWIEVTFDINDGSNSFIMDVKQGGKIAEPQNPVNGINRFEGWYWDHDNDGTTPMVAWNFSSNEVTKSVTLVAQWTQGFTVTVHGVGGYWVIDGKNEFTLVLTGYMNESLSQADVQLIESVEKAHQSITGWFIDAGYGTDFVLTDTITSAIDIYAKWEVASGTPQYTVMYDTNGGTPVPIQEDVYMGSFAAKPADPALSGYEFDGWFTEDGRQWSGAAGASDWSIGTFDEKDRWNFSSSTIDEPAATSITLYAKWLKFYTVTFNLAGGQISESSQDISLDIVYGQVLYAYSAEPDSDKAYAPENPVKDGNRFIEWQKDGAMYSFGAAIDSSFTLTAAWNPTYTVRIYDFEGSERSKDALNVITGDVIQLGDLPNLSGGLEYRCKLVWSTTPDESGAVVFPYTVTQTAGFDLYAVAVYIDDDEEWFDGWVAISTAQQLNDAVNSDTAGAKYYLAQTIDLTGYNWTMATKTFVGMFDGNGYVIKNLTVSTSAYAGMFRQVSGAYITGIILDNPKVYSTGGRAGVLVANMDSKAAATVIENIQIIGAYDISDSSKDNTIQSSTNSVSVEDINNNANITVAGSAGEGVGLLIGQTGGTLTIRNITVTNAKAYNINQGAGLIGRISGEEELRIYDVYLENVAIHSYNSSGGTALIGRTNGNIKTYIDRIVMNNITLRVRNTENSPSNGAVVLGVISTALTTYSFNDIFYTGTAVGISGSGTYAATNLYNNPVSVNRDWWTANLLAITQSEFWGFDAAANMYMPKALNPHDPDYTVTFDISDGGTIQPLPQTKKLGEKPGNPGAPGEKATYDFDGWYWDHDNDGTTPMVKWVFATDTVTGDITLYAKWSIKTYTVTFDYNGYLETPPLPQTIDHGGRVSNPNTAFDIRPGYSFDGWYWDHDDDDTTAVEEWVFANDTVTGPITLIAQWTQTGNSYDVTFDPNSGDWEGNAIPIVINVVENNAIGDEFPDEPTLSGHLFDGWWITSDGTGSGTFDTPITSGTIIASSIGTCTVYAKWIELLAVTFDAGEGEWETGTSTKVVDVPSGYHIYENGAEEDYTAPVDPTREGYRFDGWYEGSGGTGSAYVLGAGGTTITAATTIYAKWVKVWTVTFDLDAGTWTDQGENAITVDDGDTVAKPSDPTKSGFDFVGWYTANDWATEWIFTGEGSAMTITSATTIYAKWEVILEKNKLEVKFGSTNADSVEKVLALLDSGGKGDIKITGLAGAYKTDTLNLSTGDFIGEYKGSYEVNSSGKIEFTCKNPVKITMILLLANANVKLDGTGKSAVNNVLIWDNVAAGNHSITKGSNGNRVFYLLIEEI